MPNIKKHWTKKNYHIKFCQFKKHLEDINIVCFVTKERFFELIYPHICSICGAKEKMITLDSLDNHVFNNENVYPVCRRCKTKKGKQEYKIPYNLRVKFRK